MSGKKSHNKGKRFELQVAKAFGTERIGLQGKFDEDHSDVKHHELFIQCKSRKELSIYNWYDKTVEETPEHKTPIVVVKANMKRPLAIIDLEEFIEIYERLDEYHQSMNMKLQRAATELQRQRRKDIL